ncbi:hypothetical protein V8G54_006447 [Vigna mungo]|uniref:Acylamino-acid-releasing enzyme N-terminal domain-containing protein n=1 Tax=Vigna mungo TaxID=3915 RepID=A0AAQ3NZZ8_VIGMU
MDDENQATKQEYAFHSDLLHQFTVIPSVDKAWIFNSRVGSLSHRIERSRHGLSPFASKLLIVRNPENEGSCRFEIWSSSQLEKEFHVPQSKHGSMYTDEWFEGISWNLNETCIVYTAEEPTPAKPTFNDLGGFQKLSSSDKDGGT